jgi:hypothetical protein
MTIEIGPRVSTPIHYDEALLYCMTLSYNGYYDWRLPVASEAIFEFAIWVDENGILFAKSHPYAKYPAIPVRDI